MDQSVINFAAYEDGNEYVGMGSATLPTLTALTQSISGAGIAGNIEAVIAGHFDAMSLSLNFRTVTKQAIRLSEPRRHNITLRVAQQSEDATAGQLDVDGVKHVFVVVPKSFNGGNVTPASPADASGEYAVRYWATYINGEKVMEIDPINYKCLINGVDYLASVRSALGK